MAKETRTSATKVTFECAPSLREKFKRQSKKQNNSSAQRFRDFMQKELRNEAKPTKAAKRK